MQDLRTKVSEKQVAQFGLSPATTFTSNQATRTTRTQNILISKSKVGHLSSPIKSKTIG
jgi:hypothetical protein